jgi:NAD(P)-dependent dehydrogenase (short-subunit alcohol dehydrogenase family)
VRAIAICPGFVDTPMASISTSPRDDMIQPADCGEVFRMALRLSPQARIPEVIIERARPWSASTHRRRAGRHGPLLLSRLGSRLVRSA